MSVTAAAPLWRPSGALLAAAALGCAAALGVATGQVAWALAGLVVGVATSVLVTRPFWTLVVLLVVEVSNASSVLGATAGVSPHLAALLLATASLALGVLTGRLRLQYSPVMLLAAVFVLAQAPSLLVAVDPATATGLLLDLAKDLWFLVVVTALALAVTDAWTVARLFTAVMALLAGASLVTEFALGNATTLGGFSASVQETGFGIATARHAGPLDDANFWGRVLLLAVPLAMTLTAEAFRRRARAETTVWAAALALLLGGVYLTQSRGTLLGLAVVLVCWLALAERATRRLLLYVPLVALLVTLVPGVGSRLATLGQVVAGGDLSLAGRVAAQRVDYAMFTHHPGLGVGLGNISDHWNAYLAYAAGPVPRQLAPHNLYLQVAAEAGLVGLAGWVVFFVGVLALAARVWAAFPAAADGRAPRERLLATGAGAALVGWAFTSLFLHLSSWRYLLLVVVVVALLDARTRAQHQGALGRAVSSWLLWLRRPVTVARIAFTLVGGVVVVAVALVQQPTATVTVAVQAASGENQPLYAYNRDVLSRPVVLPTYAAVMEAAADRVERRAGVDTSDGYRVDVTGSSAAGTVTVQASGPERSKVGRLAEGAAQAGVSAVDDQPALSRFATAVPGASPVPGTRQTLVVQLALAGVAVLLVGNLLLTVLARRRSGHA